MTKKVDWDSVHRALELEGKFDEYTTPFREENLVNIDENYQYLPDKLSFRCASRITRGVRDVFSSLVNFFAFGLRIKGREHLKALKGTGIFTVTSHFSFVDSLIISEITRWRKKLYITVAKHNCKNTVGGRIMRRGGILPLPENIAATKNFADAMHTILERGECIQFYAEKAMWLNYDKPRPLKKGVFTYASKFNVPVLPIYYEIKDAKGIWRMFGMKKRVTAHILPAVFPNEELSSKKNAVYMQEAVMRELVDKYRECFDVARDNIYNVDPECYDTLDKDTIMAMSCGIDGSTYDYREDIEPLRAYLASHEGDRYTLIDDYYREKAEHSAVNK